LKIDSYNINVGNATDIGKIRVHNEDYMAHFPTTFGYCIIVCDGMGGHAAGEIASQVTVEAIRHYLQDGNVTKLDTPSSVQNAIEFANHKLRVMVSEHPQFAGMGTTCIMALINNAEMYIANAGDSRLYLIRDQRIKQLSKDHSTVQQLIDAGVITKEEALVSDKKNQITKAIGIFEQVDATITKIPIKLKYNDKILLCSDGLTTHVDEKDIQDIVNNISDPQTVSIKLIDKANFEGGTDNITVQLVHFVGKSKIKKPRSQLKKIYRIIILLTVISAIVFLAYKYSSKLNIGNNINSQITVTPNETDSENRKR